MFVIKNSKFFVWFSAITFVVALVLLVNFGLSLSIDFTGGSIIEVEYDDRPAREEVLSILEGSPLGETNFVLQPVEDTRYMIRSNFLAAEERAEVMDVIATTDGEVVRESTIGPSVGDELRSKSILSIVLVIAAIILFIIFAFRKVSYPVKSWKYGVAAVVSMVYDLILPIGFFALLGALAGYETDLLFVMALLVTLGYSVNDTIVVFDRVRENILLTEQSGEDKSFSEVVGASLSQTYARSINTSLTTIVVLVALYIFGGEATKHFSLVLIVGVIAGSYSSIFLASPLLVFLSKGKNIIAGRPEEKSEGKTKDQKNPTLA